MSSQSSYPHPNYPPTHGAERKYFNRLLICKSQTQINLWWKIDCQEAKTNRYLRWQKLVTLARNWEILGDDMSSHTSKNMPGAFLFRIVRINQTKFNSHFTAFFAENIFWDAKNVFHKNNSVNICVKCFTVLWAFFLQTLPAGRLQNKLANCAAFRQCENLRSGRLGFFVFGNT